MGPPLICNLTTEIAKRMMGNTDPLGDVIDDRVSENSDVIPYSEEDQFVSDGNFASSENDWDFEEDTSACTLRMVVHYCGNSHAVHAGVCSTEL